jgi:hypothetical protein
MAKIIVAILLAAFSIVPVSTADLPIVTHEYLPGKLTLFYDEGDARGYCPQDKIAWLNLQSLVYHLPNCGPFFERKTANGAYVCKNEVDRWPGTKPNQTFISRPECS